jgi:hypothetical protein
VKPDSPLVALRARREEPQLLFDGEEPYALLTCRGRYPLVDDADRNYKRREAERMEPTHRAKEKQARFEVRILWKRSAASRLRSLRSPLRGLDADLRASHGWHLSKRAEVSTAGTCTVWTIAHNARTPWRIDTVSRLFRPVADDASHEQVRDLVFHGYAEDTVTSTRRIS